MLYPELPSKPHLLSSKWGTPQTWSEIWLKALSNPSVENYEEILSDPDTSLSRTNVWMWAAFTFCYLVQGVALIMSGESQEFGRHDSLETIICAPIAAMVAVLVYLLGIGLNYVVATGLGGQGDFDKHAFAVAAYYAPITIIAYSFNIIPILGSYIFILAELYSLYLGVVAVKAVHQFGWIKAILTVLSILIVAMGCMFCAVMSINWD